MKYIALYIMWPTCMYVQSVNFLRPLVMIMHLQEIQYLTFDLDPKVIGDKVTWNVAQYPLHHVTYAPANFDVATSPG